MKASELIAELEKVIAEGGDLEVFFDSPEGKIKVKEVARKEYNTRAISHYQYIEIQ